MKIKETKLVLNISLIFIAFLLIYGIFSPWLTVATIFNVSGTSSVYGLFVFVSAFMFFVYGMSGILQNSIFEDYKNLIRKITLITSTFTLFNLMYLIYRYLSAINEFNKITTSNLNSTENLGELGQSLDNLFETLTNALRPTIGLGFYIISISLIIGLIISIPLIDDKNIKVDKFGKLYFTTFCIIFVLVSIFIYFSTIKSDDVKNSAETANSKSLQTSNKSEDSEVVNEPIPLTSAPNSMPTLGAATDINTTNPNAPEIKEIMVRPKLLTIVWNPVFNQNNEVINNYQYRFKLTLGDWSEPLDCNYSSTDTKNLKSTDTLSCEMDWSAVPEEDIKSLTNSQSQGLTFSLRAIDNGVTGDWSFKPYVIYLYEYPEFLGN